MKKDYELRIFNEIRELFLFDDKSLQLFKTIESNCRINGDMILYITPTFALAKECFQQFCEFNEIEPSSSELNTLWLQKKKL